MRLSVDLNLWLLEGAVGCLVGLLELKFQPQRMLSICGKDLAVGKGSLQRRPAREGSLSAEGGGVCTCGYAQGEKGTAGQLQLHSFL